MKAHLSGRRRQPPLVMALQVPGQTGLGNKARLRQPPSITEEARHEEPDGAEHPLALVLFAALAAVALRAAARRPEQPRGDEVTDAAQNIPIGHSKMTGREAVRAGCR